MIPHLSILITKNERMMLETEYLLRSFAARYHGKFLCTIHTEENDQGQLSPYLSTHVKERRYSGQPSLKYPWTAGERWHVDEGDICVCLDSDVIAVGDVKELLLLCQQTPMVYGVIALMTPFTAKVNNYTQWQEVYRYMNMPIPEYWHMYTETEPQLPYMMPKDKVICPYYINHGVIVLPMHFAQMISLVIKDITLRLNKILYDCYWLPQLATTIALDYLNLPRKAVMTKYNYFLLEEPPADTVFYHYALDKNSPYLTTKLAKLKQCAM